MKKSASASDIDIELIEKVESRLKSIAHPMRIAILELLAEKGKQSVTEIYKAINIDQASTSNHLKILKETGVVGSARNGQKIMYSIKPKNLKHVTDCVNRCLAE